MESCQTEENKESKVVCVRDPEIFIENLAKNSLFFCSKCYQYVFEIEKKRHFPDCKDAINLSDRKNEAFVTLADAKIRNLMELSRYTGTQVGAVEKLYRLYELGDSE